MTCLNTITLIGKVNAVNEKRTPDGRKYYLLTVETSEYMKDAKGNSRVQKDVHRVTVHNTGLFSVFDKLRVGHRVCVQGALKYVTYDNTRMAEIVVRSFDWNFRIMDYGDPAEKTEKKNEHDVNELQGKSNAQDGWGLEDEKPSKPAETPKEPVNPVLNETDLDDEIPF